MITIFEGVDQWFNAVFHYLPTIAWLFYGVIKYVASIQTCQLFFVQICKQFYKGIYSFIINLPRMSFQILCVQQLDTSN